jgi:hypothetical protein
MSFAAGYLRFAFTRNEPNLRFAFTHHNSNYRCTRPPSPTTTTTNDTTTNHNRYYLSTATMRLHEHQQSKTARDQVVII